SGFPECNYKRSFVQKTGAICPQCGGDLVQRKSRGRVKIFFGCANYPTCNFATWNRPLPLPCPECHGLLTQANGAKEAICQGCGAVVEGIADGAPVVIGHRAVGAAANGDRPKRASRSAKKPAGAASANANGTRKRTTAASTVARSRSATAHT